MKNFIGKKFGRLTILSDSGLRSKKKEVIYLCECDCGNKLNVRSGLLSSGKTKSCGCLYKETRTKDMSSLNNAKEIVDGVQIQMFSGRTNNNNTTGLKGVYKHGKGYRAKIVVKRKTYYGKTRETKEEAYSDRLKLEESLIPKIKK